MDVTVLSETYLKPHERFFGPIITFIELANSREEKAFPITMLIYDICAIHTLDKYEAYS
jgi:hypothetical protein